MQLIGITRETKLGQYCAKADWASAHGLQYQTKPNQEGVLVLNKQIVLEIIFLCQEKTHYFRDQHKNMEAINAALRKIKYRGEQKLTQYLLTEEDMTRISTVNRFLTKLDIFSICHILCSLAGDCCTSTSTQAERVFSWMGFLLNKRRLSLSGGESVTMQLFLNDNLEL